MAKARLTKAGAILLAKAIAGTQLTFTRGAFGDAAGSSSVSDKTIDSMTSLINETMSLPIADFKIQNNQAIVTLTVKNESVTEGFRVAEGGLFALNPDNNKEILYAYFFDGNDGDFMPAGNADMQLEYAYEFITAVSNATNVTAIIDKSSVGIMRDEFEEHIYSANPHPNLDYVTHPELTAHSLSTDPHPNWKVVLTDTFNNHVNSTEPHPNWEVVEADTFNSHINSTDPHPNWEVVEADTFNSHINSTDPHPNWEVVEADTFNSHVNSTDPHPNWDVVKAGVGLSKSSNTLNVIAATDKKLGGIKVGKNLYMSGESLNAEAGEVDVESRLKQLEINQANLYILLEALNKFGVQGNLIMTEDFQTLKYTHTGSVNATVETEGKEFITDGVSFLRPNNFCVLSNGLFINTAVTVDSVKSDGVNYTLTAADKFARTTSRGKVYRSSVTIKDNKAYGAGEVKVKTQSRAFIWKGEGYSDPTQISFDAYPSLESSFTLDGDWSLTSDGYFTLE